MIRGIDISEHQDAIDFQRVKSAGVTFVIPREGYRDSIDDWFLRYVKGAQEVGLQILGVYHFIYTDGATIKKMLRARSEISEVPVWIRRRR